MDVLISDSWWMNSKLRSLIHLIPYQQSTMLTSIFLFLTFCVITYHWKRRRLYILASKLHGPISLPIIGNAYLLMGTREESFKFIHRLYAGYRKRGIQLARVWVGPILFIVLADIKMISAVLNQNLKKAKVYHLLDEILHRAIFVNPNIPQWKAHRKAIVPVFNFSNLKSYIPIFHSEAAILVDKWQHRAQSGAGFNPENEINLATFDMVMMSTLGISPQAQDNPGHEFLYHIDRAFEIGMRRMFNPLLYSNLVCSLIGLRAKQKAHCKVLVDVAQTTLNQIRERLKKNKNTESNEEQNVKTSFQKDSEEKRAKSFAELMMENENYDEIDDEVLIGQIITIIGAGQDTTKSQNMVSMILLALHQDVQDKVIAEVDQVLGSDPSYCPTYEDLCKLELLEMVIKESLRLFPTAPIIARHIDEDFELENGLTLWAGVTVFVSIYAVHHDPRYYVDPDKFDPGRWTPQAVAQRPPNCFIPFSTGPRNCIGGRYAMMQMKTVLSTILRTYRILPTPECARMEDIGFDMRVTIKLNDNCKIRLQRRTHK